MWKKFPARKARALQEFSTIEKDSGCQLLWSLQLTKNEQDKAFIYQHVLEELFHAEIFDDLSQLYSDSYIPKTVLSREILIDKKSTPREVCDFFSYAHVGEEGVNGDFVHYANAKLDKKITAVFQRVAQDEGNHIYGTKDILKNMTKDTPWLCEWLILKSTVKRQYKQMKASTRFLGDAALTFLLGMVYYIVGIGIHKTLKRRYEGMSDAEVLELLLQQEVDV